nr:MAG TPA: hypothetical protein [Caudoviricetes sp.]
MKRDFALIKPNTETGEHEVQTITLFDNPTEADMAARAIYGATAYAKESSQYDVQLPCIVKDGVFHNLKTKEMRNEQGELTHVRIGDVPAEYIPTEAEQIGELKRRNEELEEVLDQLVLKSLGGE